VLIDELHVMGSIHYASRVVGQIRGALESKRDSFLVMITTQSDELPAGVFRAELRYARAVRDGRVRDARTLPVLYEFPEAFQLDRARPWADPAHWPAVMPNLGRSLHIDAMEAGFRAATEKGEEELRRWASQHLNLEIGLALHSDRWRGADYWEGAGDPALTLDEVIARSEVITVGIDGGGLDDLLGMAVLGRCRETHDWLLWSRAWCQDDVLRLRKEIAPRLEDFARDGDLVLVRPDDPTGDVADIAAIVKRIFDAGLLPAKYGVGLDPVGVAAIIDALAEVGVETEANGGPVCAVFQGYKLNGAIQGAERKLKDRTLRHGGRPMMGWVVGNAKTETRGSAMLVTKQAAGRAKIDPLVAAFNAFMLMSRGPEAARGKLISVPAGYSLVAA
jgi:phage terminase large subunit-like protein